VRSTFQFRLEDAVPTRSFLFALCAAVSLTAAAVAAEPSDKCPPRPGFAMISQEQRLMMFADLKAQADASAVDIEVLRPMQRDKFRAMSEDQRKAYFADLTKRWNALSAGEKLKLKAEALKWRAEHPRPEGRRDCPPAK
jgi:Spy/CpxP family protein refolding chaperone